MKSFSRLAVAGLAAMLVLAPLSLARADAPTLDTQTVVNDLPPVIPGAYIVMSKSVPSLQGGSLALAERTQQLTQQAADLGVQPSRVYSSFGGYAATMTAAQVEALRVDSSVEVFPDRMLQAPVLPDDDILTQSTPLAGPDFRQVSDANIDEALNTWPQAKVVIFSLNSGGYDMLYGFWTRKVNVDKDGSFTFADLNMRKAPKAAEKFGEVTGVTKAPALVAVRNGATLGTYTGTASERGVRGWIESILGAPTPTVEPTKPTLPPTKPPTTQPTKPTVPPTKPPTTQPTKPTLPPTKPPTTQPTKPQPSPTESVPPGTNPPTWNLDQIDQRGGKDGTYAPSGTGKGINVYITDSGINVKQKDFTGRTVIDGFSPFDGLSSLTDKFGHGTHVASTVAGNRYGVAKQATLISVRVFDDKGAGPESALIASLDWVAKNFKAPGVVQASWGERSIVEGTDKAVQKLVDMGIPFVNAAGNLRTDACKISPTHIDQLIRVGATDEKQAFASMYSDYGKCVDIFAPGSNVEAGSGIIPSMSTKMTGTSMAAPHVAGAAAIYLEAHPKATATELKQALIDQSTKNIVTGLPADTPNRFVYVGK